MAPETENLKQVERVFSVLKVRSFMIFALSQAVSLFGDKLNYMALLAMIAYFSQKLNWESARAISFLSVVITLPTIIFGPFAGILIDRWDKRKVLLICDFSRAILVALIPIIILKTQSLFIVYSIAFLVFLFGLFFNTSRLSIIPNLVAQSRLLAANSLLNFLGRIATFLGIFLGGIVVDLRIWRRLGIPYSWSAGFYLDSLTYWVSVLAIILIYSRLRLKRKPSLPTNNEEKREGTLCALIQNKLLAMKEDLREAVYVIIHSSRVLSVFGSILLMVILGGAVFVLFIPIIQSTRQELGLGLGTRGVGFIGAVGALGLMISSLGYGIIGHRIRKERVIYSGFIILGFFSALLGLLKSFLLVIPIAFLAGLILSPVLIAQDTLLHETVPEEVRGRVFSTREWFLHLSFALSAFITGQLTIFIPKRELLFGFGVLILLLSLFGFFLISKNR